MKRTWIPERNQSYPKRKKKKFPSVCFFFQCLTLFSSPCFQTAKEPTPNHVNFMAFYKPALKKTLRDSLHLVDSRWHPWTAGSVTPLVGWLLQCIGRGDLWVVEVGWQREQGPSRRSCGAACDWTIMKERKPGWDLLCGWYNATEWWHA